MKDWKTWIGPAGIIAGVFIGIVFIGQVGGCQAIRDTIASAIGAPTSEDVKVVADQIDLAETQAAESQKAVDQLNAAIAKTDQESKQAAERQQLIRATFADAAARLPNLTGIAADALMDMMSSLQAQLRQAKSDEANAAALVADFRSKIIDHQAALTQANQDIDSLTATLNGFDQATSDAIGKTVGLVRFAGDTAATLGVPGAKAATDTASGVLGGILTAVLGTTAVGTSLRGLKHKRIANGLTRVVQQTEKLGLIRTGPDVDSIKAVARKELGPDVMAILHAVTAQVA